MDDHSINLTAAIADLKRRRNEIDAAIASMETILSTVYGMHVPMKASDPGNRSGQAQVKPRGTRAEKVRKVFAEQPDLIWTSEALAAEIGEDAGEQTLKAIHAILSRLKRSGAIVNVGRGQYRATDTSGPADAGPEAGVTTTGEGGDPHAHIDPDHGDDQRKRNRDDRGGAAVGAFTL